jgi:hypothetical protein
MSLNPPVRAPSHQPPAPNPPDRPRPKPNPIICLISMVRMVDYHLLKMKLFSFQLRLSFKQISVCILLGVVIVIIYQ